MNNILWVDDEIDLLKPYILFLEQKNYAVHAASNGHDAIDMFNENSYDIVFLDENMPGISGLEVLAQLNQINPSIPVVMITKSEEENIMDMAIGNKMADYLIKPVNPNQILLTLKKHIHKKDILTEQNTSSYRQDFMNISMKLNDNLSFNEWLEMYRKLTFWDMELSENDNAMIDTMKMQWEDANRAFCKFIKNNYTTWFSQNENEDEDKKPLLSHQVMKNRVFPLLDNGDKVFMIIIDNFRYDQLKMIQPMLAEFFNIVKDEMYCSILPTATQYARNALISGLTPLQIKQLYPNLWVDEDSEEPKNNYEAELLETLLTRYRRKESFAYAKIVNMAQGDKYLENFHAYIKNDLNVCVLNFIDMLSHARTDSKVIRELANNEAAFRSLATSWFRHSSIFSLFKELAQRDVKVLITTDHGTIRVNKAIKVVGEKNISANLRYKQGRSLAYNKKEVLEITKPETVGLPLLNISTAYIFAQNNDFFAYPNNYNHYVKYYTDTFQHGGVSMEEMMIPLVICEPKK